MLQLPFLNLWHDEVYTLMAAQGIFKTGLPTMPSGLIYSRAFPLTYLTAVSVALFGQSEFSVRLPVILVGILSLFIFYKLLAKLTNKWIGLAGAFILTLSPWHLMYSFFARSYIIQALLFFLTGWLYYLFLQKKELKYLYWNIPVILLNSLLSTASFLNMFFLGFVFLWLFFKDKKILQKSIILMAAQALAIFVSFLIPGAIPAWPQAASQNPYSILGVTQFILPNKFFFRTLFGFFPLGSIILFASLPYFWIKDRKFFIFPFFIFASFLFLSLINPFENLQPRYLSYFMLVYYFSVFYFLYKIIPKKNPLIFLMAFFLVSDVYLFPKMYNLNYGKELPKTAVVSLTWTEFPDIKSQVEYVNENYRKGDVVISIQPKGQTESYLDPQLNYILRTRNYDHEGHFENGIFVDDYSRVPMITSVEMLKRIINGSKRIWIISSKSENPAIEHIDKETYNFISKMSDKIVFEGKEKDSKTYLITNNEKK